MEDTQIIDLYLQRDETAIRRTAEKSGARLRSFAFGIVKDRQTAEEYATLPWKLRSLNEEGESFYPGNRRCKKRNRWG